MGNRCRWMLLLSTCVLCLSTWAYGGEDVFIDDFDTAYDYLEQQGVGNTGWDGFIGLGSGETAEAINANIDMEGMLYMSSEGGNWDVFDDYGPFLYKLVDGDFKATTYVGDFPGIDDDVIYHNDSFIMARDPEGDTDSENFESINYFPTWVGILGRNMVDSVETEWGSTGDGYDCARYIQLERIGDEFYFRYSQDGEEWDELSGSPVTRDDLPNILQVGVGHCTYSTEEGYVAFEYVEIEGVVDDTKPYGPDPSNDSTDIDRDSSVTWMMGKYGDVDNLYFGLDSDAVSSGAEDVLVGEAMTGIVDDDGKTQFEYTPEEELEFGATYYWRAEDVNNTTSEVISSKLWSFTTEPYAYLVEDATATATAGDASVTIDGTGLDSDGLHSTDLNAMWTVNGVTDVSIVYDLNEPVYLSEMLVWNGNSPYEAIFGMGINEVVVEYSLDGENWTVFEGVTNFAQGPGAAGYACNNVFDMEEIETQYIRLTPVSNFGANVGYYNLSAVQFYSLPVEARNPSPVDGYALAEGDELDVELAWRTGRTAVTQKIYLDTDAEAVADGTAPSVEQTSRYYQTEGLLYDVTYYWRVAQVTEDVVYESPVWSFSTPEYNLIDNFESYDEDTLIWEVWVDGYDTSDNGALVGYDDEETMETATIYSGSQSMPYEYGFDGLSNSEATIDLGGQDWTAGGVETLVFFVLGERDNTAGQLYVKINSSKVPCTANLTSGLWTQVNVDLGTSGANLSNVTSLTIGVDGGSGMMYIDDVRLYREIDEPVVAVEPSTDNLLATYSFEQNLTDSVGSYDANSATTPFYNSGGVEGYAIEFDGVDFSVGVPLASKIASMTDATFSIWVSIDPESSANWARAFDFGTSTDSYLFLCPRCGTTSGGVRAVIMPADSSETIAESSATLADGWHHLAVTFGDGVMTLYVDSVATSVETDVVPSDLGTPDHAYLGQSPFSADGYFYGMMDEFVVYERTLSAGEIRWLAGDN